MFHSFFKGLGWVPVWIDLNIYWDFLSSFKTKLPKRLYPKLWIMLPKIVENLALLWFLKVFKFFFLSKVSLM